MRYALGDRTIKVTEAAKLFGVCAQTLITWDKSGLLKATRSPAGYREYRAEDIAQAWKRLQPYRTARSFRIPKHVHDQARATSDRHETACP